MIKIEDISIVLGNRILLNNINLNIYAGQRIALVGVNGAGKTTLLKIIAGILEPDRGKVVLSSHTTVGYLPQETVKLGDYKLYDEVYNSLEKIKNVEKEIKSVEAELKLFNNENEDEYLQLLDNYNELQYRFSLIEGHKIKSNIEKVLIGLGFTYGDFEKQVRDFSGGWHMRIELAKLLLRNPSVLLLDEPTNNLDFDSLLWLENYLKNYKGALVIVSHDTAFLNSLTTQTIELINSGLRKYHGNYDFYLSESKKQNELLYNRFINQQKYLSQQEKFIERFRYKASKAKAVQSRIKLINKIEKIELEESVTNIDFAFPEAEHSGRIIVEISNLNKSYDGRTKVLDDFSLNVERGDKIGLIGKNGTGKSTLLKILAGKVKYESGMINWGYNVKSRYFSQDQAFYSDSELTVLESMKQSDSNLSDNQIRNILGSFLFSGDDVIKQVKNLSGGEKSRLSLAKMLTEPSNFLIMDEPTNHLDVNSKNVLLTALQEYSGSILIVSHDRSFIDGFINKVLLINEGKSKIILGNSTDYQKIKENEINNEFQNQDFNSEKSVKSKKVSLDYEKKQKKKKLNVFTAPIKRRISEIEEEIKKLEGRKKIIELELSNQETFKKPEKVIDYNNEYKEIIIRINKLNDLWEKEVENLSEIEFNFLK